jgi:hypothetical protein
MTIRSAQNPDALRVGVSTGVGDDGAVVEGEGGTDASEPEQATRMTDIKSPIAAVFMGNGG